MRKVLGVDVDITLVRTDLEWVKWLNKLTGNKVGITPDVKYPYDLTKLYPGSLLSEADGYDFWRGENIYDNLSPIEGSVDVLKDLSKRGYDIVFVSQIKGNHQKSKYYFLKKHFPFMAGAIWTKEKHYVRLDAMIDDRVNVLNKMPDSVDCFLLDSCYTQSEDPRREMEETNWNEIKI